jgi:hypothetical protein
MLKLKQYYYKGHANSPPGLIPAAVPLIEHFKNRKSDDSFTHEKEKSTIRWLRACASRFKITFSLIY